MRTIPLVFFLPFVETFFVSTQKQNINRAIRASKVRLIHENEQLGIVPLEEALKKAQDLGLDLVEVGGADDIPTCKIMDFGKHFYKKKKLEQKHKQSQKQRELKSIRLGASTDVHDLKVKEEAARRFLKNGHPTKVMLVLRGREHMFAELAQEKIAQFAESLKDAGTADDIPRKQGSNFIIILNPLK
jgi:translation initiation factor IF-3